MWLGWTLKAKIRGRRYVVSKPGVEFHSFPEAPHAHRLLSSSFLWLVSRILPSRNPKKELLRSLWV